MKWILILIATSVAVDDSNFMKGGEFNSLKDCTDGLPTLASALSDTMKTIDLSNNTKVAALEKIGVVCIREDKFKQIEELINNRKNKQ